MLPEGLDPSLMQDFLTESSELIEKLDVDLVTLESLDEGPEQKELLAGIFRALHTIKGAASFLALTTLTTFAHAAEDALNLLRKGEVKVTPEVMDAMLRSVDVLRVMLEEIDAGQEITPAPEDLISQLHAIVGKEEAPDTPAPAGQAPEAAQPEIEGGKRLALSPEKADLVEFMVVDLQESVEQLDHCLDSAKSGTDCSEATAGLVDLADTIRKTSDFFGLDGLCQLSKIMVEIANKLADISETEIREVYVRLDAMGHLIALQAEALTQSISLEWPLETFQQRLESLAQGKPLDPDIAGKHDNDREKVLELDGVLAAAATLDPSDDGNGQPGATATPADQARADVKQGAEGEARTKRGSIGEQTIRVEVSRLESLLNLVGRLVLNKNRVLSLSRKVCEHHIPYEVEEQLVSAAGDLDQLTSELQVGVMRTRMQPLGKLFDRYPRVIRDIARATEKKINLEIVGKETEVDKTVLEMLADPLVHILRNSADHGVEMPDQRTASGKSATGTVRLTAEHQGSHVRVEITDDGKGLDREVLGSKAIERGLVSEEQLAALSDREVFAFIFSAGFSTAEKVTDLSGRGVGMDVVRTNIAKINGTVTVDSVKGQGTTIEILIPLTVAIMPAMMVGVGQHLYAVPLTCITEIVRPEGDMVQTVKGQPVMRLRNSVLPLLDLREKLGETGPEPTSIFAVVVAVGDQRAGLVVDRLIGQHEIVIKPLDDRYTSGGPFSGATIREDGDVSLILDVIQLIRQAQVPKRVAA